MAVTTKELALSAVAKLLPRLSVQMHKGQAGRIGVIGGSFEYTGAPYFAAISALKAGADLVHVFCPPDAAPVIKGYSPDLIVHPILNSVAPGAKELPSDWDWLGRMHSVVVGPGLGRDPSLNSLVSCLFRRLRDLGIPVVVDADGLYYFGELGKEGRLPSTRPNFILTPNIVEYKRLVDIFAPDTVEPTKLLKALDGGSNGPGLTLVAKGATDRISRYGVSQTGAVSDLGSPRRCGGQGDLLSGTLGLFAFYAHKFMTGEGTPVDAAIGACALTRLCAEKAYASKGRSTTTADLIHSLPLVVKEIDGL